MAVEVPPPLTHALPLLYKLSQITMFGRQCTGYWALYLSCMSEFELVPPTSLPIALKGEQKKDVSVNVGDCCNRCCIRVYLVISTSPYKDQE